MLYFPKVCIACFQRSKTDSFTVEAVDLGRLEEVVICHDGKGYGEIIQSVPVDADKWRYSVKWAIAKNLNILRFIVLLWYKTKVLALLGDVNWNMG